jgi:hypothetical protein
MLWKREAGKTVTFDEAGMFGDYAAVTGFKP